MQPLLLMAFALTFFALPLWPAWRELRRPQDNAALDVDNRNPSDALRPLKQARELLQQLRQSAATPADVAQVLSARHIAHAAEGGVWEGALPEGTRVVLSETPLRAKPEAASVQVVYAPVLRASGVLDYVVSAQTLLVLDKGCEVRSAHAEQVWAGEPKGAVLPEVLFEEGAEKPLQVLPGAQWLSVQQRWQAGARVALPDGACLQGDLVAQGEVHLGVGCLVKGSIKADRVLLGDKALVSGNVVAREVTLGRGAGVKGCVVCDEQLSLGPGAQVGTRQQVATALACDVTMAQGSRVLGTVQAHRSVRSV